MSLRYGSICSGIEAATVAWEPLGWKPAWFCENAEFPSAVLTRLYPNTLNLGDMRKIYEKPEFQESTIDVIVGGTPCQSFSLAGGRAGLDDPRGDLALEFLRIVKAKQPKWFIWENVPGVMSSGKGRDFSAFLGAIQELGYGFAYRILNAQYFGVPQQRRRVFVVGNRSGNWGPSKKVLFDDEDLLRDTSPIKDGKTSKKTVIGTGESSTGGERVRIFRTIKAGYYKCYNDNENLDNLVVGKSRGKTTIRRLTPLECERLMGFEDNYTLVPFKGKSLDSLRYKAVGNSMVVPVMRWLGERIALADKVFPI